MCLSFLSLSLVLALSLSLRSLSFFLSLSSSDGCDGLTLTHSPPSRPIPSHPLTHSLYFRDPPNSDIQFVKAQPKVKSLGPPLSLSVSLSLFLPPLLLPVLCFCCCAAVICPHFISFHFMSFHVVSCHLMSFHFFISFNENSFYLMSVCLSSITTYHFTQSTLHSTPLDSILFCTPLRFISYSPVDRRFTPISLFFSLLCFVVDCSDSDLLIHYVWCFLPPLSRFCLCLSSFVHSIQPSSPLSLSDSLYDFDCSLDLFFFSLVFWFRAVPKTRSFQLQQILIKYDSAEEAGLFHHQIKT